jgi:hypothetical protein
LHQVCEIMSATIRRRCDAPLREHVFSQTEELQRAQRGSSQLTYFNLEHRVCMLVTPTPVGLLLASVKRIKLAIFVMVCVSVHAVRLIFATIPVVVVMMGLVVVDDNVGLVLGSERSGSQCEWRYQGDTQEGSTSETWRYLHIRDRAVPAPLMSGCLRVGATG